MIFVDSVRFSHDFCRFSHDLVMIFGDLVIFSHDLGTKNEKAYIETWVV